MESLPAFEQVFIAPGDIADEKHFSARLYMGRRKAEKQSNEDDRFHIASLGTNILSYKGLMMPVDLPGFYLDLADERLETAICVFPPALLNQYHAAAGHWPSLSECWLTTVRSTPLWATETGLWRAHQNIALSCCRISRSGTTG